MDQDRILVVDYLLGLATVVFESLLMCVHRHVGRERGLAEPCIFLAAAAQHHHEEVYLKLALVGIPHPHLSEVNLGILAIGRLFNLAVLARR